MDSLARTLDVIALLYATLFFPAPFFWLIIHPAVRFWRKFRSRAYWVAVPVWVAFGGALWVFRQGLFADRLERSAWSWILGALLVAAGLWVNRHVHREFSLKRLIGLPELDPGRNPGGVVRSGIYSRVRHPRYLEFMLTFVGLALLTGAVGIFLLAIVTILMYLIVVPLEERELRARYGGEHETYAQEVPRFLPRLRRKNQPPISP
jgi:protein-S-isoprenylcysteine O-methyltransferase Ste14